MVAVAVRGGGSGCGGVGEGVGGDARAPETRARCFPSTRALRQCAAGAVPTPTRAQVFGTNPWLWLLPVWGGGPAGDGVHWPSKAAAAADDAVDDDSFVVALEEEEAVAEGRRLVWPDEDAAAYLSEDELERE